MAGASPRFSTGLLESARNRDHPVEADDIVESRMKQNTLVIALAALLVGGCTGVICAHGVDV